MDNEEIENLLVELEAKYPNKIYSIGRFNKDKTIITKFSKQTLLDKYFDMQTQDEKRQKKISANLEKFKQTTPDKSTAIIQRKDDLKKKLKDDLYKHQGHQHQGHHYQGLQHRHDQYHRNHNQRHHQ